MAVPEVFTGIGDPALRIRTASRYYFTDIKRIFHIFRITHLSDSCHLHYNTRLLWITPYRCDAPESREPFPRQTLSVIRGRMNDPRLPDAITLTNVATIPLSPPLVRPS